MCMLDTTRLVGFSYESTNNNKKILYGISHCAVESQLLAFAVPAGKGS